MKKSIIFILFFISLVSFSREKSKAVDAKSLSYLDREIEKIALDKKKSKEDKFYLYSLAAREYMTYGFYEKALKFYDIAIDQAVSVDMIEAYYNRVFVSYRISPQSKETKNSLRSFKEYTSKYGKKYEKEVLFWEGVVNGELKENSKVFKSYLGVGYKKKLIESLIKKKKFLKALSMIPKDLSQSNINNQIESDILTTVVYGRGKKLYCEVKLAKYKNSKSSMLEICRYLKNKSSLSLVELKKVIFEDLPDRSYLIAALEGIK